MKKAPKLGNYEVLRELETGGMGKVLLARKRGAGGFEKLFAIKVMRSELRDQDAVRSMFLDEAQLLARIEHPAVAQVYDFGDHDGGLYLVMEYVSGINFREVIELEPPPGVAARLIAAACRGLHAAHEVTDLAGNPLIVVHRDVSPENLMLTFDGHVKVLDFGIALMRDRRAPVTEFGTIKGKPPYLSPEQIKNETIDRRTDIFASCIVLHEMLTGEPVFTGGSVYAVARAIEHETIRPPSESCGLLPLGLDEAVLRGVQRDPADRFSTALELAEELERIADNEQAESLAVFVRRELGEVRDRHREELRAMLSGSPGDFARARPTGVVTALAETEPGPEVVAASKALGLQVAGGGDGQARKKASMFDEVDGGDSERGEPGDHAHPPGKRDDGFRVTQVSEEVALLGEPDARPDARPDDLPDDKLPGENPSDDKLPERAADLRPAIHLSTDVVRPPSRLAGRPLRMVALVAVFAFLGAGVAWLSHSSKAESNAEAVELAASDTIELSGSRSDGPSGMAASSRSGESLASAGGDDPMKPGNQTAGDGEAQSGSSGESPDDAGSTETSGQDPVSASKGSDRVRKKSRRARRDEDRDRGDRSNDADDTDESPRLPSGDPEPVVTEAAAGTGKVTITAEGAYALVRIDGKGMGTTPIFGLEIPAGEHTIILARPDSGEVRLERVLVVEPGGHHRVKAR